MQQIHDHQVFEIDQILAESRSLKGRPPGAYFLIKWRNFDNRHNSWEPEENISRSAIEAFRARQKQYENVKASTKKRRKKRRKSNLLERPHVKQPRIIKQEASSTSLEIVNPVLEPLPKQLIMSQVEKDLLHADGVTILGENKLIAIDSLLKIRNEIFFLVKLEGREQELNCVINTAMNEKHPSEVIQYYCDNMRFSS